MRSHPSNRLGWLLSFSIRQHLSAAPSTPFVAPSYTFYAVFLHLPRYLFTPSVLPSYIFHTPLSYLLLRPFMPFASTKTRWRSSYDDRRTHLTTAVTQHVWRSPHACTTAAIHPLPRHNRATLTPSAVRQYCPKPQPHSQNNNKTGCQHTWPAPANHSQKMHADLQNFPTYQKRNDLRHTPCTRNLPTL